jgi:hypothetical protein
MLYSILSESAVLRQYRMYSMIDLELLLADSTEPFPSIERAHSSHPSFYCLSCLSHFIQNERDELEHVRLER